MSSTDPLALRRSAEALLQDAHWSEAAVLEARCMLGALRSQRAFRLLAQICERLVRRYPKEPMLRRLQAQALIEEGLASAAIEVASAGLRKLSPNDPEWSELQGLIGRAHKQIALETENAPGSESLNALKKSIAAYSRPFNNDSEHAWSAINLVALRGYAERAGVSVGKKFDSKALARSVIESIKKVPSKQRDEWAAATLAEASLALNDIPEVQKQIRKFLSDDRVQAFHVSSALRQFSQVWGLRASKDDALSAVLLAMHTRLMQLPDANPRYAADELNQLRLQRVDPGQLEAILGDTGTQSFEWWQLGLNRARAVGAIHAGLSRRIGTGFLVAARDLGVGDSGEPLLLTNFHVVNRVGSGGALRPTDAQVVFDAVAPKSRFQVTDVVWESPVDRHDAAILRLSGIPADIELVPVAPALPIVEDTARVYVIGYPGGGGLEFSFQDNALLDHEGPPLGKPPIAGVTRVHYRAPTEPGSSGSPVFNSAYWQAIALHHAGGQMSALNAKPGTVSANEGIGLLSISDALRSAL